MAATDVSHPDYYHKVVDCQWACPAHTNVPGYHPADRAWAGTPTRTCSTANRTSSRASWAAPATARASRPAGAGGVDDKPVAICRLKRVAADRRGDITDRLPTGAPVKNGKRVACIGAGPASLTVANDLLPLGYEVTIFEQNPQPGGLMRINIPRLPPPGAGARRGDATTSSGWGPTCATTRRSTA